MSQFAVMAVGAGCHPKEFSSVNRGPWKTCAPAGAEKPAPNSSILSPRSRGIHKHKSQVKRLNQVFTSTSHKSSIPTGYPQAQVTSQASGSLPPQHKSQVKHLNHKRKHKSSIWIPTPLQRFTSTSQGSPPHCRGSPAQVKHLDPYPNSRDRHPIAEVSTASQPHCRGRYSQHHNPIAEVFTAENRRARSHCLGHQPKGFVISCTFLLILNYHWSKIIAKLFLGQHDSVIL